MFVSVLSSENEGPSCVPNIRGGRGWILACGVRADSLFAFWEFDELHFIGKSRYYVSEGKENLKLILKLLDLINYVMTQVTRSPKKGLNKLTDLVFNGSHNFF